MNKNIILFALLVITLRLYAQQPPARLPSLLEGIDMQTPRLITKESADEIIRKNIFVKATVSKKSVYAGEPLLVTYKLYTALNSQARVSKQPYFSGCSVLELSEDNDPHVVTINGKQFHVFTIRKVQVTPLQEGTLQLGQAFVENVIQLTNADGSDIENYSTIVSNDPVDVEVKALPVVNKPKDFSNIVGNFNITARIDTNAAPAGENVTLNITIKGSGNIAGVGVPVIQWPKSIEHFDGSDTQHVDQENYPVTGYKIFEIPFIGNKEGNVVIPPIYFSYFDASLHAYKTLETNSIAITFTKAITRNEQMKNIVTEDVSNKKYLWIVAAIAVTVILVWFINTRIKDKQKQQEKIIKEKQNAVVAKEETLVVTDPVSEIFTELNDLGFITTTSDFLLKTKSFLTRALQIKLSVMHSAEQDLIVTLQRENEYGGIASTCEHIYETCNRNLYSPVTDENIQEQIYFELTSVIKKIYNFS